tara:strand:- start:9318 stop:10484 length:1167 start_codon:yes stop_codon:yes gene_type:complete
LIKRIELRSFDTLPLFPTAVVGSLPRPLWILDSIQRFSKIYVKNRREAQTNWENEILDRYISDPINRSELKFILDQGIKSMLSMQTIAGINVISDGEWRRTSFTEVICSGLSGFQPDLLNGFVSIVTNFIKREKHILKEEALFLLSNTKGFFKIALPTPLLMSHRHWSSNYSVNVYPHRQDFINDLIPIIANEAIDLIKLGVPYIQFDDPGLCLLVDQKYCSQFGRFEDELNRAISSLNDVIAIIRKACPKNDYKLGLHLCRAHRKRGIGGSGDYFPILDQVLQVDVDQYLMEFSVSEAGSYNVLKDVDLEDKTIGLGIIDVRDKKVSKPEIIKRKCEKVLKYIEPNKIWLNPDCGFSPGSTNPIPLTECYRKLKCLSEVALLLREEF